MYYYVAQPIPFFKYAIRHAYFVSILYVIGFNSFICYNRVQFVMSSQAKTVENVNIILS